MMRNEHSEPVNYALRIWIVDERRRLKGTLDYCTFDVLGSHTPRAGSSSRSTFAA